MFDRLSAALAGRYRIERELGAGGMATVYLAEDLKHDRKVAIKVLKPELAAVLGADRFVVEIKTTAAMSHPHILPLFDSGTADGFLFYVMPYIQGETIRAKLNRETQFGIDEAVRIAREVADALDYAHRHGVIHRDIKPENILLHDGRAMVMDFGIALAVSAAAGGRMTETGLSLGTPHYMSPEQATAEKEITPRSDVYSLASVLYEMLAGQPPHIGGAAQQVIMKIITEVAQPVRQLRKNVPANVEATLAKALEKLPADRFESARMFADALSNAGFTVTSIGAHSSASALSVPRRRLAMFAAIAAVGVIAFLLGRYGTAASGADDARATFSTLEPSPDEPWTLAGHFGGFAISPEGRRVALTVDSRDSSDLIIRSLDSLGAQRLRNTNGATQPFWSPDGHSLGFFAEGMLKVIELSSGAVRTLCPAASPQGASWGADDVIIFTPEIGTKVFRTSSTGRECTSFRTFGAISSRLRPQFLADGRHFVATNPDAAWLSSVSDDSVSLLVKFDATSQQAVVGLPDYLLFIPPGAERSSFHAQRIDVKAKRLVGPIVPLMRRVAGATGRTAMLTSTNGTLLAQLIRPVIGRVGRFHGGSWQDTSSLPPGVFSVPRVSKDGRQFVVGGFRISVWDAKRNLWSDVVPPQSPPTPTTTPAWSPADSAIVFRTSFNATASIMVARTTDRSTRAFPGDSGESRLADIMDWSRDGRHIALLTPASARARFAEAWVIDVATGARSRMFEETASVSELRFSPDGRRVVYERWQGNTPSLFIRPFPGPASAVRVMAGEGRRPVWSSDGRSLYYEDASGNIAVVSVNAAGEATGAAAIALPSERIEQLLPEFGDFRFDVAPGTNDIFVMASGSRRRTLTMVQNWPALLLQKP